MSKKAPKATAKKRSPATQEAPAPQRFLRPSTRKNVIVDDTAGVIYTDLGPDYGSVKMSKGDFELFLKDYSRHYGPALDQNEMAIRWGFPGPHAVAEFVRIHGIRHTSIPFTDEELSVKGVEGAVDEAVLQDRRRYLGTYQHAVTRQLKMDAAKYHQLEDSLRDVVREFQLAEPPVAAPRLLASERPFSAVLGLSDLHYGKVAYGPDGTEEYNPAVAAERAMASAKALLAQITQRGKPERLYLLVGSDGLHFDNKGKSTARGTPLAISSAGGSFARLVAGYAALYKAVIRLALELGCPLRLVILPGNHDPAVTVMLGLILREAFGADERVSFLEEPDETVLFDVAGNVTFAFNHGEQVKEKTLHREFLTAARTRGVPLGVTLVMVSGHLHHLKLIDCDGVDWLQLPSPGGHDDYHKEGGFNHARPGVAAAVYGWNGDLESTHHIRF